MSPDVVIAGGGLAGIAAGVRAAEGGARVVLLETRARLGGRATSHVDQASGEPIDNCQHVAMGCCTNYVDLLARLGAADALDWTAEQHWIEAGGRVSRVAPGGLPPPGHFLSSFFGLRFLSTREKVAVARGALALGRLPESRWLGRTFGDVLRDLRQPRGTIRRFWEPIIVSACNLSVDRVAACLAVKVVREGFLAGPASARVGVPNRPLVDLYDRVAELLAASGGAVRTGAGVERLAPGRAVLRSGEEIACDRVICALPFERALDAVRTDDGGADPRLQGLAGMTHSPIVGVHLGFDRDVLPWPHAVLVERETDWLFSVHGNASRLHAVKSAAESWLGLAEAEILRRVETDVRACLPDATDARVVWGRAIKEKRATFAGTPGFEAARPHAEGAVVLAGDYVATGWPATMEGATRSGYGAAAIALGREPGDMLVADLGPEGLSRWMVRPMPEGR